MALVDQTYFNKDISAPAQIITNVMEQVDYYEKEILISLLGRELYDLMIATPTATRFDNLINGADFEFEFNGCTVKEHWNGFVNDDKRSLIAFYTYYNYRNENDTFFAANRQVKSKHENSNPIDSLPKLVSVWNDMIRMYGQCNTHYFVKRNISSYQHVNDLPSAYNYLLANKETYPEWVFTPKEKQNLFLL